MNKTNDTAVEKFMFHVLQIENRLDVLKEYCVENSFEENPESVNWGTVGSSGHVLELLNEVLEFLNIKMES